MDEALGATTSAVREAVLAPKPSAPALLPAYLDMWVQTSPRPALEPDLPLFLHGPQRDTAEVQIVWRADITDELLDEAAGEATSKDEALDEICMRLSACPPSGLEAIAVPVWVARSWLQAVAEGKAGRGACGRHVCRVRCGGGGASRGK